MSRFTKQVSLHGRRLYLSPHDVMVARSAVGTGGEDKPSAIIPGAFDIAALWDDFLGDLVGDEWAYVEGDTGYSGALQTATNGIFRILSSNTGGLAPTSAAALTQGLFKNWKADMGSGSMKNDRFLRLSARVKLENITRTADRIHAFIGFSDSGGAEMPAYDTGAGIISNAADLMGFLFSPGGDTGWSLIAAKSIAGDSGDQLAVAGAAYAPVANTYQTLELEFRSGNSDTGGAVHFWIDGKKVGRISAPVASTVALTPWIGMWVQDTGDQYVDIDAVAIAGTRDTGE